MSTGAKKNSGNKLLLPALGISSIICIFTLHFGFIFILIAMLPSMVAYFIDRDEYKSAFRVVFLFNLAATLPTLLPMIHTAIRMERSKVVEIMSDARVWLLIYSGAAAAWCLIFLCRFIGRFLIILYFEYQVASLERFQKKLIAEWGTQVTEK